MESVNGIRVVKTDAKTHNVKNTEKYLQEAERGEEVDVPGGMPTEEQAIIPLCRLSGWIAGSEGDSNSEKVSKSLGHQVTSALL